MPSWQPSVASLLKYSDNFHAPEQTLVTFTRSVDVCTNTVGTEQHDHLQTVAEAPLSRYTQLHL